MPLYEFECEHGHTTAKMVHMRDAESTPHVDCMKCYDLGRGWVPAHRVLSATATTFRHNDRKAFK